MGCAVRSLYPRPAVMLGVNNERLENGVDIPKYICSKIQSPVYCGFLGVSSTHSIMGIKPPISQCLLCLRPGETLIVAVGCFKF